MTKKLNEDQLKTRARNLAAGIERLVVEKTKGLEKLDQLTVASTALASAAFLLGDSLHPRFALNTVRTIISAGTLGADTPEDPSAKPN